MTRSRCMTVGSAVFRVFSSFFVRAWCESKERNITIDTLVSLSLLSTFAWSVYAFFTQRQTYIESLLLLLVLLFLGDWFERGNHIKPQQIHLLGRSERVTGHITAIFAPAIILIASLVLIVCSFVLSSPDEAFRRAMTVLLLAVPVAMAKNPSSSLYRQRPWAFFYACLGIPFALFGLATPAVVDFFLICSSVTMFVSAFFSKTSE